MRDDGGLEELERERRRELEGERVKESWREREMEGERVKESWR